MPVELRPGQYQLGSARFGRNTMLPIESMEVTGYGVSTTEYQLPRADEMRFGIDTHQPGVVNFTIGIIDNYALPNFAEGPITNLQSSGELLENLHREWSADDIRKQFGYVKPLYACREGETVRIYGRPGKFAHDTQSRKANFRKAVCEFRRVDTFVYSEAEYSVVTTPTISSGTFNADIPRSGGGAPTWVQIYITGPIIDPWIQLGNLATIKVDHELFAGEVLEINTYPWTRRVIDSNGFNVAPKLIGSSPYLDEIMLAPNFTTQVGFYGTGTDANTKMAVLWREAYHTL